jgi:hypothetical protein
MPFLNLDKNWSSLAQFYNQPFVNKPKIPTLRFVGFDDGLVRGGVLNAALATGEDVLRISKFFSSVKGVLFITKQVGLQKSNPKLESPAQVSSPVGGNIIQQAIDFAKNNPTQTYNLGLNTLTQVGVQAAGLHIVRHGLLPKFISDYNYEKVTLENNKLQGARMSIAPDQQFVIDNVTSRVSGNSNRLVNYLSILNLDSTGPITLQDYNGGASSVYGIGRTKIRTTSVRTTVSDQIYDNPDFELKLNGFTPLTNAVIQTSSRADLYSDLEHQLENSPLSLNINNSLINKEYRVGTSYKNKSGRHIDSINAINITDGDIYYNGLQAGGTYDSNSPIAFNANETKGTQVYDNQAKDLVGGYFGRDIARFILEFIDNDATSPVTDVLTFRAYIDDFQDGMNAKWNPYRYMGRGEEFYVYEGFSRDISVSFTMYAHNPEEMKPLYQKLNYLMSTFAPDYSAQNKMRGNIGYLTVGDYVRRVPGVFTDIKLTGFMDTHWEINLDYKLPSEPTLKQNVVPKLIKVGLSFKPIHNKLPRKSTRANPFKSNFILPGDSTNQYA